MRDRIPITNRQSRRVANICFALACAGFVASAVPGIEIDTAMVLGFLTQGIALYGFVQARNMNEDRVRREQI